MDKIQLLQERKTKLMTAGKEIRADVQSIIDEDSFVELSAFSFSKKDFFNKDILGEGVVTGFATISGYPFYIIAQNFSENYGGLSKANCDKMVKCLDAAEKNMTPVIYLLNTNGVQIDEGVTVLEGMGKLLLRSTQLKGVVPQYVVVNGDVYGSAAMLAAIADFTFFLKGKSVLTLNSPFVLSAKASKNLKKEEVGGAKSLNKSGLVTFEKETLEEVKATISEISELISVPMIDAELNETFENLNNFVTADAIASIFENPIELNASYEPEVKTVLGRIGGISVAALIFDGADAPVFLTQEKLAKIKSFVEFASCYGLPFISFADVQGVSPCMSVNNSRVMKETAEYLNYLDTIDTGKISVVYKNAVGLGYSLFASKSVGFDYACAFANARISLFDSEQSAKIEGEKKADVSDPIYAAKDGYIDGIIEPQFVKQYLIAALQMLLK